MHLIPSKRLVDDYFAPVALLASGAAIASARPMAVRFRMAVLEHEGVASDKQYATAPTTLAGSFKPSMGAKLRLSAAGAKRRVPECHARESARPAE
jgi:hypothetical protein